MKNVKRLKALVHLNVDQLVKMFNVDHKPFASATITLQNVNVLLDHTQAIHITWQVAARAFHAFTTSIVHQLNYVIAWHTLVTMFAMNRLAVKMQFAYQKIKIQPVNVHQATEAIQFQKLDANWPMHALNVMNHQFVSSQQLVIFANVHQATPAIQNLPDASQ